MQIHQERANVGEKAYCGILHISFVSDCTECAGVRLLALLWTYSVFLSLTSGWKGYCSAHNALCSMLHLYSNYDVHHKTVLLGLSFV